MKLTTALSLLASCLASCNAAPASIPAGSLVVAIESEPNDIDPRFATDANASRVTGLIFAGLVRPDGEGGVTPDLAASWEKEGETAYLFHLRPHVHFHDGAPLRAADVRATYESVLNPELRSPKRQELAPLAGIDTPDDATVRFRLRKPFPPFLSATALGILPEQLARKPHLSHPRLTGAGPFRLSQVFPGQRYVLSAFAGYYEGTPKLNGVVFRIVPDGVVRCLELGKGTIDFVQNALEPETLPWLGRQSHLDIIVSPGTSFHYLGLNLRHPILRSRQVRQALAYAIDRRAIVDHVLSGNATPASGLLSPSHWAYEPDVATYETDPARARKLLDEAGYPDPDGAGPGARFSLTYKTSTVELRRRIAEALQYQLRGVGVELTIRSFEWATFYSDIRRGDFELFSLAWVGINDPDIYYSVFHSRMRPPEGNNRGGYANRRIDRLTEEGRTSASLEHRRRIYSRVQQIAAADLPYIPLWWEKNVVVKDKRLRGFLPRPDGDLIGLKDAYLERRQPGGRNR